MQAGPSSQHSPLTLDTPSPGGQESLEYFDKLLKSSNDGEPLSVSPLDFTDEVLPGVNDDDFEFPEDDGLSFDEIDTLLRKKKSPLNGKRKAGTTVSSTPPSQKARKEDAKRVQLCVCFHSPNDVDNTYWVLNPGDVGSTLKHLVEEGILPNVDATNACVAPDPKSMHALWKQYHKWAKKPPGTLPTKRAEEDAKRKKAAKASMAMSDAASFVYDQCCTLLSPSVNEIVDSDTFSNVGPHTFTHKDGIEGYFMYRKPSGIAKTYKGGRLYFTCLTADAGSAAVFTTPCTAEVCEMDIESTPDGTPNYFKAVLHTMARHMAPQAEASFIDKTLMV